MSKAVDYKNEVHLFEKVRQKGQKITQLEFCRQRSKELGTSVNPKYFNKVLGQQKAKRSTNPKSQKSAKSSTTSKSRDWDALKTQFMLGKFSTISDLARHCGLHPSSSFFRKKTAGWADERAKIEQTANQVAADLLAESQAMAKIRTVHVDALAAHLQLFELMGQLSAQSKDWSYDTPVKGLMGAKFVSEMQDTFTKILPAIQGLHQLASVNGVFDRLSAGEIDPTKASLELLKMGVVLPRPLEIMLSRHIPDDAIEDDSAQIDEARILERRRTMLLEIEEEKSRLIPERTAFVNKLKEERKSLDSFTAEAKEIQDHGD